MKAKDTEFGYEMSKLYKEPRFKLLQGQWLGIRTKLIELVKKHKREEDCARLQGFDDAVLVVEKAIDRYERSLAMEKKGYRDPLGEDE